MRHRMCVFVVLLGVVSRLAPCQSETAPFRLAPPPTFHTGYVVSAANGDPRAKTTEEVFTLNSRLAAGGSTDAAFELGLAYLQGVGVPQSRERAEMWFTKGAVKPEDKELIAMFYRTGLGFPQDATKAEYWYRAAGRPGDLFELAQMFSQAVPEQVGRAAALYVQLLTYAGHPEVRRAQMSLGNYVLDGKYSAGESPEAHAEDLQWARAIAQEVLGQQEYTIAVAYAAAVDGVPKNDVMWRRFCKRAAAYNVDLAQHFYGKAILEREVPNTSPLEGYAWIKLASDKQYSNRTTVKAMDQGMTPEQALQAQSLYDGLVQTRERDGAYYSAGDPLLEPSADALRAMPDDDPDVQLRRAFALGKSTVPEDYQQSVRLYRIARDRRGMDIKVVLGRDYLRGAHGVTPDARLAAYWLKSAADAGSHPAALYLAGWCRGEGGGAVDPVQAYAWELIGTEAPAVAKEPADLSANQKVAALTILKAWVTAHPGW